MEASNKKKKDTPPHGGHRQRLREKFIDSGLSGFHDYEAVELLLTFAIPRRDVKPLAKALLKEFKGLRGVIDASHEELSAFPGIGDNAAVLIRLVKETGKSYFKERIAGKSAIGSAKDVVEFLSYELAGERVEKFMAIYMNAKNEIEGFETLHEGTLHQTAVYPRKVIEQAFKHNARSLIFVHNHPSGDSTPSKADIKLTGELEKAANAVDIIVHDHIVIGRSSHYSFKDTGLMKRKR